MIPWTTIGPVLLLCAAPIAQDTEPTTQTEAQRAYEALQEKYDQAEEAYREAIEAAEPDDRRKIYEEHYPQPEKYAADFFAIADKYPGDPGAGDALLWIAQRVQDQEHKLRAIEGLLARHANLDELPPTLGRLGAPTQAAQALLRRCASHERVAISGHATFGLASMLNDFAKLSKTVGDLDEDMYQRYADYYGEETMNAAKTADVAALRAESEKLYEAVVKNEAFAALEYYRGTLGEKAERNLFEARNLIVGKVAPDIEGEDVDGNSFKLSDYRGKVVFLDFWGDW